MFNSRLQFDLLPERFVVARLDADAEVPSWAHGGSFSSVTRTLQELSIVCQDVHVPPVVQAERDLRCLAVRGPLSFSQTGILASFAGPLARAGVSIFVISTFDTDYLLVADQHLALTLDTLDSAGYTVHDSTA